MSSGTPPRRVVAERSDELEPFPSRLDCLGLRVTAYRRRDGVQHRDNGRCVFPSQTMRRRRQDGDGLPLQGRDLE